MVERLRFRCQRIRRHDAVFGLSAVNKPVVETIDRITDAHWAGIRSTALDHSGKLMTQYDGEWARLTSSLAECWDPSQLCREDGSRMHLHQHLPVTGHQSGKIPIDQRIRIATFIQENSAHWARLQVIKWV